MLNQSPVSVHFESDSNRAIIAFWFHLHNLATVQDFLFLLCRLGELARRRQQQQHRNPCVHTQWKQKTLSARWDLGIKSSFSISKLVQLSLNAAILIHRWRRSGAAPSAPFLNPYESQQHGAPKKKIFFFVLRSLARGRKGFSDSISKYAQKLFLNAHKIGWKERTEATMLLRGSLNAWQRKTLSCRELFSICLSF